MKNDNIIMMFNKLVAAKGYKYIKDDDEEEKKGGLLHRNEYQYCFV